MPPGVIVTASEAETAGLARGLASTLRPGDVVLLTGELGAGKTVFVRGLAEGLGIDPRRVHSPSFTIVSVYGPGRGGTRLVHADLYRVDGAAEIEELGLAEYLEEGCVAAVEWGERLPARLRAGAVRVALEDLGGDSRGLTIERG